MLRLPPPQPRVPSRRRRRLRKILAIAAAVGTGTSGIVDVLLGPGGPHLILLAVSVVSFVVVLIEFWSEQRHGHRLHEQIERLESEVAELRELSLPPSLQYLVGPVREQGIEISREGDSVYFARAGRDGSVPCSISALDGPMSKLVHRRLVDELSERLGYEHPWRVAS